MITNFGFPQSPLSLAWATTHISQLKAYFNPVISKDEAAPYITLLAPNLKSSYQISVGNDGHLVSQFVPGNSPVAAGVFLDVRDFGAVGDGISNDTIAIQAALNMAAGREIFFPSGSYLVDPLIMSSLANFTLSGSGRETSILLLNSAGALLTISGANFCTIQNIGFYQNGTPQSLAGSQGVVLDSNSDNVNFLQCNFIGFAEEGLYFKGVIGGQLSGNKVEKCNFLGNGGTNGQLRNVYNNDCHILNNQCGTYTVSATTYAAAIGMMFDLGGNGNVEGNYCWSNTVGMKTNAIVQQRIYANRLDINLHEGLWMQGGGTFNMVFDNLINANSQVSDGNSDNVLIDGEANLQFTGNKIMSWNSTFSRYGVNVIGTCHGLMIKNNRAAGYDTVNAGPYFISTATAQLGFSTDRYYDGVTASTIGSGLTRYLGPGGASDTEVEAAFGPHDTTAIMQVMLTGHIAPSPGSFTSTLRVNGVDTSMTASVSGSVQVSYLNCDSGGATKTVLCNFNTGMTIELVTDGSAAAAVYRYLIWGIDC